MDLGQETPDRCHAGEDVGRDTGPQMKRQVRPAEGAESAGLDCALQTGDTTTNIAARQHTNRTTKRAKVAHHHRQQQQQPRQVKRSASPSYATTPQFGLADWQACGGSPISAPQSSRAEAQHQRNNSQKTLGQNNNNNNSNSNHRPTSAASYGSSPAATTTSRSSSAGSAWCSTPSPVPAIHLSPAISGAPVGEAAGCDGLQMLWAPHLAPGSLQVSHERSQMESQAGVAWVGSAPEELDNDEADEEEEEEEEEKFAQNSRPDTTSNSSNNNNNNMLAGATNLWSQTNNNNNNQQQQQPPIRSCWPANHPLGNTKHLCSICGDRATGKHYGVFSCEGCKGFFKRTIRKDIVYACRAAGNCPIDMQQRNRCQHCRYQKCLRQGMKREAVQEEKQRLKLRAAAAAAAVATSGQVAPTGAPNSCWPPPSPGANYQLEQPMQVDARPHPDTCYSYQAEATSTSLTWPSHQQQHQLAPELQVTAICSPTPPPPPPTHPSAPSRLDDVTLRWAAQVQVEQLLDFAKGVAGFGEVLIDDQVTLLRTYWNELIVLDLAFRSAGCQPPSHLLCIGRGLFLGQQQAAELGLGAVFERIQVELVEKLAAMQVDANELACLRAIVLFNPETHGLKSARPIEDYRGQVYTTLELYCRQHHPSQPNRFGKLLLRLPALRSIGLRCQLTSAGAALNQRPMNADPSRLHLSPGASSPTGSVSSSTSSTNTSASSSRSPGASSPTGESRHHHQAKLLFFDECYEASSIDAFLRSNLTPTHHHHHRHQLDPYRPAPAEVTHYLNGPIRWTN